MASRKLSAGAPKREERLDPSAMAASMEETVVQGSQSIVPQRAAAPGATIRQPTPEAPVPAAFWFRTPTANDLRTPTRNDRAAGAEQGQYASRARHAPQPRGPRCAARPAQDRRSGPEPCAAQTHHRNAAARSPRLRA